ncbi:sulfotransferase domain-containing protein [Halomonas sp. I1]|uniref:sulfotransferase domain-containing protein n=1 Tax=Halomonas sp. I1 TaxID=393536 RepID=UPI0028DF0CF8|nr:sulfotransferase domain-containing protein [Halomonas sp. I1]MDT8893925.1 sulfotransferase domain-containing protein [Halomonas sp. I1]
MIENLFLSAGAMKAGTTWLYERLKDHPDIFFTPEKEIHYFANVAGIERQLSYRNRLLKLKEVIEKCSGGNPKFISKHVGEISWYAKYAGKEKIDGSWYESLFEGNSDKKYCADFSNLYCQMDRKGWAHAKTLSNNIKVIYTLRDPLERLWSHYKFHHKWVGKEDSVIDDGLGLFEETLGKPWFYKNSSYLENFNNIVDGVGKENVMLLYFEDFRENPQREADKIAEFLGITKFAVPEKSRNEKTNATKDIMFPDEWKKVAKLKLSCYADECKKAGLWHPNWQEVDDEEN